MPGRFRPLTYIAFSVIVPYILPQFRPVVLALHELLGFGSTKMSRQGIIVMAADDLHPNSRVIRYVDRLPAAQHALCVPLPQSVLVLRGLAIAFRRPGRLVAIPVQLG